ncbi:MAG: filamentous hemagglutinin N-terminal domain-containing protein [Alphaproteobacteria bacterium]|nr:filamentous hemagglutinin N-terminal domain-containing protein [Alphaproteobacteria bacterium]
MTNYNSRFVNGVASLLTIACLAGPALAIDANTTPTGGTVVGGAAAGTISTDNATHTQTVTLNKKNVIADYTDFSVGSNATVNVIDTVDSNFMARVAQGGPASQIDGAINAKGRVWIINNQGIHFGPTAKVTVGGLVASTLKLADSDDNFINNTNGKYRFKRASSDRPGEIRVDNGAEITATAMQNGLVAMIAPNIKNDGAITAYMGRVEMGAGDSATLAVDPYGDGLINLAASEDLLNRSIENNGIISADGGAVKMSVATVKNVVDGLININGVVEADTVDSSTGKIILSADTVGIGTTGSSGALLARGDTANNEVGGSITIEGKEVYLCCGYVDARGKKMAGTGQITIKADTLWADKDSRIKTHENVTITPLTDGTAVKVAEGDTFDLYDGNLHVSKVILNDISAGSITIGSTTNTSTMQANAYKWKSDVTLQNGSGDIEINGKQTMGRGKKFVANTISGDMIIGTTGQIVATHTKDDAVTLAASGGKFVNNRGSDAIVVKPAKARWLVYAKNPYDNTFGNLDSGNTAVWHRTYDDGDISQSGNRYIFAYQPTATFRPDNMRKYKGVNYTAEVANDTYSVTGVMKGVDYAFLGDTYTGPIITSKGADASAAPGKYAIKASGVTGLDGYKVVYRNGILNVIPNDADPYDAQNRTKGTARKGPMGTLLSIVNTNAVPAGTLPNLPDLAPAAGGNTTLADLAPHAGGTTGGSSITPLIQCTEATPCDINQ